jgi:hypothetical protein
MSTLAAESDQPVSTVMSENGWAVFWWGPVGSARQ